MDGAEGTELNQLLFSVKECIDWPQPRPVLVVVSPYGMQVLREISRQVERGVLGWEPAYPGFAWDHIHGVAVWTCNHLKRDEVRTYCTWGEALEGLRGMVGPEDIAHLELMAERDKKALKHG